MLVRASDLTRSTHKTDFPSNKEIARFRRKVEISMMCDSKGIIKYGIERYKNAYALITEDFGASRRIPKPAGLSSLRIETLQPDVSTFFPYHAEALWRYQSEQRSWEG